MFEDHAHSPCRLVGQICEKGDILGCLRQRPIGLAPELELAG